MYRPRGTAQDKAGAHVEINRRDVAFVFVVVPNFCELQVRKVNKNKKNFVLFERHAMKDHASSSRRMLKSDIAYDE